MSAAMNLSNRQFRMKTATETPDRGKTLYDTDVLRKPTYSELLERGPRKRLPPKSGTSHNRTNDWGTPDPKPGRASGHGGKGWE